LSVLSQPPNSFCRAAEFGQRGTAKKNSDIAKTLVNDVSQIRIVKAAEVEAKKDGIATETFASRNHAAIEDQINIIETLIARGDLERSLLLRLIQRA
jgi:ABC-type sugar transport system substrate-binding protein